MLQGVTGKPTDMTFDAPRNRFLVTVTNPPALLVADASSQTTSVLSDATRAGPFFGRPVALELLLSPTLGGLPSTPIAFVLDSARACILAVDTVTGERVIRTK